jgi:hypothetical protein
MYNYTLLFCTGEKLSLILKEEQKLGASENKVLRQTFDIERVEIAGEWVKKMT